MREAELRAAVMLVEVAATAGMPPPNMRTFPQQRELFHRMLNLARTPASNAFFFGEGVDARMAGDLNESAWCAGISIECFCTREATLRSACADYYEPALLAARNALSSVLGGLAAVQWPGDDTGATPKLLSIAEKLAALTLTLLGGLQGKTSTPHAEGLYAYMMCMLAAQCAVLHAFRGDTRQLRHCSDYVERSTVAENWRGECGGRRFLAECARLEGPLGLKAVFLRRARAQVLSEAFTLDLDEETLLTHAARLSHRHIVIVTVRTALPGAMVIRAFDAPDPQDTPITLLARVDGKHTLQPALLVKHGMDFPDSAKAVMLSVCDAKTLVCLGAVNRSWRQAFKDGGIQTLLDSKAAEGIVLYWTWEGDQTRGLLELDGQMCPASLGGSLEPFQLLEKPVSSERPREDPGKPREVTFFATKHDIRRVDREHAEVPNSDASRGKRSVEARAPPKNQPIQRRRVDEPEEYGPLTEPGLDIHWDPQAGKYRLKFWVRRYKDANNVGGTIDGRYHATPEAARAFALEQFEVMDRTGYVNRQAPAFPQQQAFGQGAAPNAHHRSVWSRLVGYLSAAFQTMDSAP
ncbi:hypothetical protein WJX72_012056 [[Myrmecia] bisecta]|uniref:Uncharacterized protein n=1 Tax=[Myrmecia] bisecta TaxID=41462 RepID=A0AAW1P944_9CHLO